jgi:hypothetical protein
MQSKHLSEMSTHVNDAFDTATGLRDRGRLDSSIVVNEQKYLAQDRIDAFEKSELAHHLVTSAVNHAQSAAENAKKAVAIYKKLMKNQSTAFASVHATSSFNDTLQCHFDVDAGFTALYINLVFLKIDLDLHLQFSLDLDLSFLLKIADHAFKEIWKEIKSSF